MKTWSERDANAAGEWLAQQPESAGKQLAARQLVNASVESAPQFAWTWALKLVDPVEQVPALESVVQNWMGKNPDAARAAVQGSSLSAELKRKLLRTY